MKIVHHASRAMPSHASRLGPITHHADNLGHNTRHGKPLCHPVQTQCTCLQADTVAGTHKRQWRAGDLLFEN